MSWAVSPSGQVSCESCPIRHRAVCARCEPDEFAQLESMKFYRTYEAGQTILFGGDPLEFVASVVSGVAMATRTLEDGRTQMVGLLLPSDFIGRPGRKFAPFTVSAVTDVRLCCFRSKPFANLIEATPHIAQRLLEMTLDELDAAREWMLLLGRKTAREKIASFLAIIARRYAALAQSAEVGVNGVHLPAPQKLSFDLPLTRESMSDYLGLTIETVSRQISALKRDGVIALEGNRHVSVPNLDRLLAEAGDDSEDVLHDSAAE